MKHADFAIGTQFTTDRGLRHWRCTDVGTRVVVAIRVMPDDPDPSWYHGPPYAVAEHVFDENDMEGCEREPLVGGGVETHPWWRVMF